MIIIIIIKAYFWGCCFFPLVLFESVGVNVCILPLPTNTNLWRSFFCSTQLAAIVVENEEAVEIRSIMMAGVELALSCCSHNAAVEAVSEQSSVKFWEQIFSLPKDRDFPTKTWAVAAARLERQPAGVGSARWLDAAASVLSCSAPWQIVRITLFSCVFFKPAEETLTVTLHVSALN